MLTVAERPSSLGRQTRSAPGCSATRTPTDTTTASQVCHTDRSPEFGAVLSSHTRVCRVMGKDPGLVQRQGGFTMEEKQAFLRRYEEFRSNDWRVGTNWGVFALGAGLENRYSHMTHTPVSPVLTSSCLPSSPQRWLSMQLTLPASLGGGRIG
jgi:hypothetical protein